METLIVNLINEQKQSNKLTKKQIKLTKKQNKLIKKVLVLNTSLGTTYLQNNLIDNAEGGEVLRTPSNTFGTNHGYTEVELCTVKEAQAILNVSRWKVEQLYNSGELTPIWKGRSVRLILTEVEEARIWYSAKKGKV